jgi:hypothetical protein
MQVFMSSRLQGPTQGPTTPRPPNVRTMTDYVAEKKSFSLSGLGLPVLFSPGNLSSCVGAAGGTS